MIQKTFSRNEIHKKFLIIGSPLKKLPRYKSYFESGFYDLTIQDEAILERQFGKEYNEYKKTTPRFFPKLSNFWMKRK